MPLDELREYGLVEMDADEIEGFLTSQRVGVLGLPAETAPYLLPISYGYDGGSNLYFTYVFEEGSRKAALTESAEAVRFLVFAVDTMYNWESVLVKGSLSTVPESNWGDIGDILEDVWQPEVFRDASESGAVRVYELRIDDYSGIKHQGLPPALDPTQSDDG